jgi:hypothetical protein
MYYTIIIIIVIKPERTALKISFFFYCVVFGVQYTYRVLDFLSIIIHINIDMYVII